MRHGHGWVGGCAVVVVPLIAVFWWLDPFRVRMRWAALGALASLGALTAMPLIGMAISKGGSKRPTLATQLLLAASPVPVLQHHRASEEPLGPTVGRHHRRLPRQAPPAQDVPLTAPYPVGITGITWTVTDADGRTATCRQRVTVSSSSCGIDTEAPTIVAPADVTVVSMEAGSVVRERFGDC